MSSRLPPAVGKSSFIDRPPSQTNQPTNRPHPTAKSAVDAYFKGEVEACGSSFVTDSKWTCTAKPPADNAWLTADFDDAKWERATWVRCVSSRLPALLACSVCMHTSVRLFVCLQRVYV